MNKLTGFAVINSEIGKKIAYTYTTLDLEGNTIKSNIKESFTVVDIETLEAIKIIEDKINNRIEV